MLAAVFPRAGSFKRVCHYVCQDQLRSQVLFQEGVRGYDYRLMARDFELIHSLCAESTKPVFHGVLLFHRDEKLGDAKMVEIAQAYLREIGLGHNQHAIVKHVDTPHTHLHLVANRIDYNGNRYNPFLEFCISNDAARKLVREYDLVPVGKKDLRQTNFDALNASETRKYAIYRSVQECLRGCLDLDELERRLLPHGIDVRYRIDKESGQRTGISFKYGGEAFRGGDVDKDLTLPRLQNRLIQQQTLSQQESQKLALRPQLEQQQRQALKEKEAEASRQQAEWQRLEKVREKEAEELRRLAERQQPEQVQERDDALTALTQAQEEERRQTQEREERRLVQHRVPRLRMY
jgi:hypothetical protein